MNERDVEFSLLEDLKMGEFDFDEENGENFDTINQNIDLEKTVSETEVDERARKVARLENMKRERMESLKKVDDTVNKYSGEKSSVTQIWDKALEDVVNSYGIGQNVKGLKKKAYDNLRKIGIDMYKRDANKFLDSAQSKANKLEDTLEYLNSRLNNDRGRQKGIKVRLEEDTETATAIADAIVQSQTIRQEYISEIENKKQEIKQLYQDVKSNPDMDYRDDIAYVKDEIKKLKKESIGVETDIRNLSTKMKKFYVRVKAEKAIMAGIDIVYSGGQETLSDLQAEIDISREFINSGSLVDEGLGRAIQDIGDITQVYTPSLAGMGETLGGALVESINKVNGDMESYKSQVKDKKYLKELEIQTNKNKQALNSSMDEMISEFTTLPYK
ncbi:hypothetical protein ISS04_02540 [Candidatus Woesearchaeota archaeon]|nr:hypothetical protein [Candidatus Woesearchaeota archaeon]